MKRDFVNWRSPAAIAKQYKLGNRSTVMAKSKSAEAAVPHTAACFIEKLSDYVNAFDKLTNAKAQIMESER